MIRMFFAVTLLIFSLQSPASAGLEYLSSPAGVTTATVNDTMTAPIKIKGDKVYNLVVSVQFMNEPYDQSPYRSEQYERFIQRLRTEWSGVALAEILKAREINAGDLGLLKQKIHTDILQLADRLKSRYSLGKDVEVVFSLTGFFLVDPERPAYYWR